MKHLFFGFSLSLACLLSSPGAHAQMMMQRPKAASKTLNVAFLIYPEVEALDLSGPVDVFVKANDLAPHAYNLYTVTTGARTVSTQNGVLTLTARYNLQNSPRPDIVIVPGASQSRVSQVGTDARVQEWLRRNATPKQTVMSVCTGAFIIARAGLLNGKNSTTHWILQSDLQRQFPQTKAFSGARFVRDGNVISTAGVSSGIDGALQMVEQTQGKATADMVARAIQYRRNMPSFPEQAHERVHVLKASSVPQKGQKLALDYDPICHMKIGANTTNTFTYKGKLYGFCSPGCRDTFAAHPEQFLKSK